MSMSVNYLQDRRREAGAAIRKALSDLNLALYMAQNYGLEGRIEVDAGEDGTWNNDFRCRYKVRSIQSTPKPF